MQQLKETLQNFSDSELVIQLVQHHDEYTPEALALLKEEVEKRNLDIEQQKEQLEQDAAGVKIVRMDVQDFKQFDHVFTRVDLELAAVILRDNEIPFYADNPKSSSTFPLESEAERRFTIHVHKDGIEKAHELLDEHFDKIDGNYQLKKMSITDQLKLFSFHELQLSEMDALEKIEVSFTGEEKTTILSYARKVLEESDQIEKNQERVLFYYDSIEDVIKRISGTDSGSLSKTELLTILEILQVMCEDPDFPQFMEDVISSLLGFFRTDDDQT